MRISIQSLFQSKKEVQRFMQVSTLINFSARHFSLMIGEQALSCLSGLQTNSSNTLTTNIWLILEEAQALQDNSLKYPQ